MCNRYNKDIQHAGYGGVTCERSDFGCPEETTYYSDKRSVQHKAYALRFYVTTGKNLFRSTVRSG